jgi:hypothetical protein
LPFAALLILRRGALVFRLFAGLAAAARADLVRRAAFATLRPAAFPARFARLTTRFTVRRTARRVLAVLAATVPAASAAAPAAPVAVVAAASAMLDTVVAAALVVFETTRDAWPSAPPTISAVRVSVSSAAPAPL